MTRTRSLNSPATIIAVLLVAAAFVTLISLGNWQLRRLAWKEDLIARVAERMQSAPLDLTAGRMADIDGAAFLAANEYRPLKLRGRFVDDATVRVFTALSDPKGQLQGPGYWVFTPLVTETGPAIFVNRGFVPFERLDDVPPAPGGITTLSGVLRAPETGNFVTPEPDLKNRVWHSRNPVAIAAALSLQGDTMPFFIDADASHTPAGGIPQAGETRTMFVNSHLHYAITWYGLALALAGVCAVYVFKRQNGATA